MQASHDRAAIGLSCVFDGAPAQGAAVFGGLSTSENPEQRPAVAGEDAFRLLVEQVVDYAIFVLDPTGHVASWNAGAQRIKGYAAEEIIGQSIRRFYRPEDVWKVDMELDVATREGRVEDEGWRVRKDGSVFWANVIITALRDAQGNLAGFGKVTRDLTERRRAEEGLRASEERFRLLVESVNDYAIFMLDPGGHVATWNIGAQHLKGYRAEEIIGQHFSRFYPEEDIRTGKCELELEIAARDGRFEDEGWRLRKDGTRFWANVVITALRNTQHELFGFAKVTRDLTDRRRAEEERLHLAEQAAARESAERLILLLTRLQGLTATLAAALTPEEVARVLVKDGADAIQANSGVVVVPTEDKRFALLAAHDAPPALVAALASLDSNARIPLAEALRTAKPVWIETPGHYAEAAADFPTEVLPAGALAALPLLVRGVPVAVMAFRFPERRTFAEDERTLMETFASQAAQALDRARTYAAELTTRSRVEALGRAAQALASALTVEDVVRLVVEHGMRAAAADLCTIHSFDERTGTLALLAENGVCLPVADRIRMIKAESGNPIFRMLTTRQAVWAETEEQYAAFDPQLAAMKVEGQRARAFWAVPLVAEGRTVGLLGMGFYEPRRFSADERDFVTTLSRQCAEALLRAQRVETERAARTLAEQLQASLSTTLRSIGDAVIATDAAGKISLMNAVAESLTGWSEAEARGHGLTEVFHIINEHTRELVQSPVEKVLEQGTIVGLANHTVLVARSGREIPIDDSGAPIRAHGTGAIEGVVLVFRDVSEKKREESRRAFLEEATAALVESLDYEATLAKVARLAVPMLADWCVFDLVDEGKATPKRVAIAHVDPAKVELARELAAKYPPRPDASAGVPSVLRTGRGELRTFSDETLADVAVDAEHLRALRWLSPRSSVTVPLKARERVIGALTFVFAESGRTHTETDLRFADDVGRRCAAAIDNARLYASEQHARQAADVANRAKDEFLAMVSHELRTPLNAIMGWAKLMMSGGFDDTRRDRAVVTIERNAVAMAQLIEDLLDISRIISGKMRLEVQQIDIGFIIEAAIESVRPAADAKGIALSAVLDTTLPAHMGDPTRLQQVVWNLLSNAVKFTSKGGRVDVVLRLIDSWAEISVSDNGKGIAPQFLPHVFDAFRQEDASFTRSRGGLGLGLAITRQLVELHGGRIEARSEGEGRGATFVVQLPISAVSRYPQPNAQAAGRQMRLDASFDRPSQLRGLNVLVVDDEEDARLLVKAILEDCGCRVRIASGVDEALREFAKEAPDVLVSDIGMPGRDGYDLIRRVRALPPDDGGDVAAAALTAYARAEDRRRMLNAGYSMHVPKPVEPAELVAVVASLTRFSPRLTTRS